MAIKPVSSVSFSNQHNSVNFEGRKNRNGHSNETATNTLKSIPLAALIALSPLNVGASEAAALSNSISQTEQVNNQTENFVGRIPIPINLGTRTATVLLFDTDGDPSNAEKAVLLTNMYNGKIITEVDISNGFTIETIKYKDGTKPSTSCYTKSECKTSRRQSDGSYRKEVRVKRNTIDKRIIDYLTCEFEGVFEIRHETTIRDNNQGSGTLEEMMYGM